MVKDFASPGSKPFIPPVEEKPKLGLLRTLQGLTSIASLGLILLGLGLMPLYLNSAPKSFLVKGNQVLTAKEIEAQISIDPDQSWFSLDAYVLSSQLVARPWIKAATVHKTADLGLVALIEEQVPIAYFRAGNIIYLLSSDHELLPLRQGLIPWDLPVFSDSPNGELKVGMKPDYFHLERGLRLLKLLETFDPLPASAISEIRIQDPLDIQVVTQVGGKIIHFGDRDWPEKLDRLKKALPQIVKRFNQVEQIDLRNYQGVAIQMNYK